MIFHLCQLLDPESETILRLGHRFVSSRAGFSFATSFLFVVFLLPRTFHFFSTQGWINRQRSYLIDASSKEGIPVMGGMHIFLGGSLAVLLWCNLLELQIQVILLCSVVFFGLGLCDDMLKIRTGHHDKGLSRKCKYLVQGGYGLALALLMTSEFSPHGEALRNQLNIPVLKETLNIGLLQVVFIVLVVIFISNAVNFADGMDGLASGPSFMTFMGLGIYAYILGNVIWSEHFLFFQVENGQLVHLQSSELVVVCTAMLGALLGFLWYNTYPASIFMGDCGSMYLGGLMATLFVFLKQELLFPLFGFLFMLEIAYVIIQDWIGISLLGRRIFFRAPYHDNLKYRGYSEPKIVVRMWILSGVFLGLGLMLLKVR